jgi:hypothetical protein
LQIGDLLKTTASASSCAFSLSLYYEGRYLGEAKWRNAERAQAAETIQHVEVKTTATASRVAAIPSL